MADAVAVTKKARAEVENVVDELVQTIQNGVSRPNGRPGFKDRQAEQLRAHLRAFADTIMDTARENPGETVAASVDDAVDTIAKGVIHPRGSPGFGASEADELRAALRDFAAAIGTAAQTETRTPIDAAIDRVVRTIRSGLFLVYGRASYAAITADQLEAYLETFVDAVLTVIEKDGSTGGKPFAPPRAGQT